MQIQKVHTTPRGLPYALALITFTHISNLKVYKIQEL